MFKNWRTWGIGGILAAILAFFGINLSADTISLSATAPTTNVDGSPVSLASIRIYKAVVTGANPNCAATGVTYTVYQTTPYTTAGGSWAYTDANQNVTGRHCYKITAIGTNGNESAFSNIAFKDVDTRIPSAPSNLTVG